MQLAKVMITSAMVLAACAEGLPEGKGCVLKCIPDKKIFQTAYLGCYTEVECRMCSLCVPVMNRSFSYHQRESKM